MLKFSNKNLLFFNKITVIICSTYHGYSVHTFSMKSNFNDPKIFTGGADITKWSTLSKSSQKDALSKSWYIYFSFRDPDTGKMKRQTNIKGEANRYKTKKERFSYLKTMQHNLLMLLKEGFNPYQEKLNVSFGTSYFCYHRNINKWSAY